MGYLTKVALAGGVLAGLTVMAAPAQAEVETFATYTQLNAGNSLRWQKTSTGGTLYTTVNSTSTVAGSVPVAFRYLTESIAYLGELNAAFTMSLTAASGNPAVSGGSFLIQPGLTGSFSFIYTGTSSFTIGTETYTTGANLLSGFIGGASIAGGAGASSGGVSASTTAGNTISFTSDILAFKPSSDFDVALTLTQIAGVLNRPNPTSSLRNFRAASTGSFSADPRPDVIGLPGPVPEPATWAMLIAGFGLVGSQLRRRRSVNAAMPAAI